MSTQALRTDFDDVLADFVTAYIECAMWSSNDESDESGGHPLDANYSGDDLAPSTLSRIEYDCCKFLEYVHALVSDDPVQAGHDFWLTRNGHGAGFCDGDWEEDVGNALTRVSKQFGVAEWYVGDDGMIYQFGSEDFE